MTALLTKAGRLLIAAAPLMMCDHCFAATSFTSGIQTGNIQNASVNEASGIVASRQNANVLWTHDDSGNPAQIFPMTPAGTNLGTYSISGASNVDWEDIALGPGPLAGSQYLYIGDIGDNNAGRANIAVYRVPEPVVSDAQSPLNTSVSGAVKLTFAYPDGARDAESMFVDPLTKDIYIISKRENPKHLYRAAYPQSSSGATTLELMTTFLTDSTWLTAADISPTGDEIIVRSTGNTSGRMYLRPPGGSITDAFNSTPISIPLSSEAQGEAIGFDPLGWGYYTTSEGVNQAISYYNRLPPPPGTMYWDNDGVAAGTYIATGAGMGGVGVWNTSSLNWYSGSSDVPWVNGNHAVFWGTGGAVTLATGQTVNSIAFKSSGYVLTAATLTLAGSSITVDSNVAATIGSTVAGSAGLVKNGNGTLNLNHGNTYTGETTVSGGTLLVMNATGSGTGTGPVVVQTGAMLGGTGTIQGNVTSSGALSPGSAIGTLHLGGNYTQATSGRLEIELASASDYDELVVSGNASLAGTLAVSLTGGFMPQAGDAFEIVTSAGFSSSTFSNTLLPALTGDLFWSVNYGANSVTLAVAATDWPGDFNVDGAVDGVDLNQWQGDFGVNAMSDADADGDSDGADFLAWQRQLGSVRPAVGASAAIPEPSTLTLLILGAMCIRWSGCQIAWRVTRAR